MATGVPKTKWGENGASPSVPNTSENPLEVSLSYEGKSSRQSILATQPANLKLLWPLNSEPGYKNHLYYGDNLPILASFLYNPLIRGQVRLVYIDPPFATKSVFQSRAQADAYTDLLAGAHYIEFMRKRLVLLRELLAEDGSIYVHLDENMAFHIKIIMDEIFGQRNFRNWITRKKCNPKNYTRRTYGNISDFILFYTKSDNYIWNRSFEDWTPERAKEEYSYIEEETGRRYKKVPLHAPGTRNGATGQPWRGMMPPPGKHWQFTPKTLDEMDARGEIYWSPNGNPRRKIYLDDSNGVPVQDIWLEFRDAHNQNIKVTGYPTEKNPQLLARIIQASSNPGDLVLDCFSGSGTTLAVASQLERNWIGIDNSTEAITTTLRRFARGPERMGDFVSKREDPNRKVQPQQTLPMFDLLDSLGQNERVDEATENIIKEFSLYGIKSHAEELTDILEQWIEWQK
jgi:adenine-specific DNA-methyltransferase